MTLGGFQGFQGPAHLFLRDTQDTRLFVSFILFCVITGYKSGGYCVGVIAPPIFPVNFSRNLKYPRGGYNPNSRDAVTPEAVRLAWQPRVGLPDDLWKVDSLRGMLEEWLELKSSGVEEEEYGRTLSHYIHTLCEM